MLYWFSLNLQLQNYTQKIFKYYFSVNSNNNEIVGFYRIDRPGVNIISEKNLYNTYVGWTDYPADNLFDTNTLKFSYWGMNFYDKELQDIIGENTYFLKIYEFNGHNNLYKWAFFSGFLNTDISTDVQTNYISITQYQYEPFTKKNNLLLKYDEIKQTGKSEKIIYTDNIIVNKKVPSTYALDVSGNTRISGSLDVNGHLNILGDVSFNTNNLNFTDEKISIFIENHDFSNMGIEQEPSFDNPIVLWSGQTGTNTISGWEIVGTDETGVGYLTYWIKDFYGGLEIFYAANLPSEYPYIIFNGVYTGNYMHMETRDLYLQKGKYLATWWSYWGIASITASIYVNCGNANMRYNDAPTRTSLIWKKHELFFEVIEDGINNFRFTYQDTTTQINSLFTWAITGLEITKYNGTQFISSLSDDNTPSAQIGSQLSALMNTQLMGNTHVYGTLTQTGIPSFVTENGASNLVINSNFSKMPESNNINNICIGNGIGDYATNFKDCVLLGQNSQNDSDPAHVLSRNSQKSVLIGSNCEGISNRDVIIGNYIRKAETKQGRCIYIGSNIGYPNGVKTGGVDCIAIGSDIFQGYNGYGQFNEVLENSIAIGNSSLGGAYLDKYCVAVGSYTLNGLIGNNNEPLGPGVVYSAITQYNTAIGTNAGRYQQLLNNCTFVGANTNSIQNNISNSTALGYGALVGANYATAIGSGVLNNTENSVKIGRSIDSVLVDGTLVATNTTINDASITNAIILNTTINDASITNASITNASITNASITNASIKNMQLFTASTNSYIDSDTYIQKPFNSWYGIDASTNEYTIYLPEIDIVDVGTTIHFRKTRTTNTDGIIYFMGNGTQKIYDINMVGGTDPQGIMTTNISKISFVALVDPSLTDSTDPTNIIYNYSWYGI